MFDFWHTALASCGFGFGWVIASKYRTWEPKRISYANARIGRDVVMACLVAPPGAAIGLMLLSNIAPAKGFWL